MLDSYIHPSLRSLSHLSIVLLSVRVKADMALTKCVFDINCETSRYRKESISHLNNSRLNQYTLGLRIAFFSLLYFGPTRNPKI